MAHSDSSGSLRGALRSYALQEAYDMGLLPPAAIPRQRAARPVASDSMTLVEPSSPATAYLTKPNIVHPESNRGAAGDPRIAADEAAARVELAIRAGGVTVTGGTIKKGR